MNMWEGVCICNMYCLWCFMWVNVCGKGVEPVTLHFHMSDMRISVCVYMNFVQQCVCTVWCCMCQCVYNTVCVQVVQYCAKVCVLCV